MWLICMARFRFLKTHFKKVDDLVLDRYSLTKQYINTTKSGEHKELARMEFIVYAHTAGST